MGKLNYQLVALLNYHWKSVADTYLKWDRLASKQKMGMKLCWLSV
jgi:hypothetical protein